MRRRLTPGRAMMAIGAAHTVWGSLAYRRDLAAIARAGVLDSVGDGLFRREHSRDGRAAAFWFMAAGPLLALCGRLTDAALEAGDRRATAAAGRAALAFGVSGVAVMPRSGFWTALPLGARLLRAAREPGAKATVDRFLERQRAMYAGGDTRPVAEMLAEEIVWHVPGSSAIAGDHRGRDAVLRYFAVRRELTGATMRIASQGELAGEDVVVSLADGRATLHGREATWRTAGVYRVADGRIAEAWLVPLDLEAFDAVWR
jgi:uncharacterized protein